MHFVVIDVRYRKRQFCSNDGAVWRISVTLLQTVYADKSGAFAVVSEAEMRNWSLMMLWTHPSGVSGRLVHVGY